MQTAGSPEFALYEHEYVELLDFSDYKTYMDTLEESGPYDYLLSPAVLVKSEQGETACIYSVPGIFTQHTDTHWGVGKREVTANGFVTASGKFLTRRQAKYNFEYFLFEVIEDENLRDRLSNGDSVGAYLYSYHVNWRVLWKIIREHLKKPKETNEQKQT